MYNIPHYTCKEGGNLLVRYTHNNYLCHKPFLCCNRLLNVAGYSKYHGTHQLLLVLTIKAIHLTRTEIVILLLHQEDTTLQSNHH